MKLNIICFGIATILLASGCAHSPRRCTVSSRHSDQELDICMGNKEVQTGDRVGFYKEKCTQFHGSPKKCVRNKIGEGEILKTLDEHLSTVKLDSDFHVDESTTIERIKK